MSDDLIAVAKECGAKSRWYPVSDGYKEGVSLDPEQLAAFAARVRPPVPDSDEREAFEADAAPMGFDLTRQSIAVPEPWAEYADEHTGYRWGGWLARASAGSASIACPDCNGYGRVNDGSGARSPYGPKCAKCGGSGRVPALRERLQGKGGA